MSNYKNYSLKHLSDCIQDCIQSEARPHEIYETIRNTVVETINYHEICLRDSKDLLSLLSGSSGGNWIPTKTSIERLHAEIEKNK
jgi:hypothetical protein